MATQQVIILIIDDERGRREIDLKEEVYVIGRHPDCDIRLFSIFISPIHATLIRKQRNDGGFYYQIIDGNLKGKLSANGLFINGHKRQSHNLENEDEIKFVPGVIAKYYIPTAP